MSPGSGTGLAQSSHSLDPGCCLQGVRKAKSLWNAIWQGLPTSKCMLPFALASPLPGIWLVETLLHKRLKVWIQECQVGSLPGSKAPCGSRLTETRSPSFSPRHRMETLEQQRGSMNQLPVEIRGNTKLLNSSKGGRKREKRNKEHRR